MAHPASVLTDHGSASRPGELGAQPAARTRSAKARAAAVVQPGGGECQPAGLEAQRLHRPLAIGPGRGGARRAAAPGRSRAGRPAAARSDSVSRCICSGASSTDRTCGCAVCSRRTWPGAIVERALLPPGPGVQADQLHQPPGRPGPSARAARRGRPEAPATGRATPAGRGVAAARSNWRRFQASAAPAAHVRHRWHCHRVLRASARPAAAAAGCERCRRTPVRSMRDTSGVARPPASAGRPRRRGGRAPGGAALRRRPAGQEVQPSAGVAGQLSGTTRSSGVPAFSRSASTAPSQSMVRAAATQPVWPLAIREPAPGAAIVVLEHWPLRAGRPVRRAAARQGPWARPGAASSTSTSGSTGNQALSARGSCARRAATLPDHGAVPSALSTQALVGTPAAPGALGVTPRRRGGRRITRTDMSGGRLQAKHVGKDRITVQQGLPIGRPVLSPRSSQPCGGRLSARPLRRSAQQHQLGRLGPVRVARAGSALRAPAPRAAAGHSTSK
jgi:hypothetical protein